MHVAPKRVTSFPLLPLRSRRVLNLNLPVLSDSYMMSSLLLTFVL